MKNLKATAAMLALGASMFGAGAAFTSQASAQTFVRNEQASASDLNLVATQVENLVDHLQHDASDYGGHRVAAIKHLREASAELRAALQYDNAHKGK